MNPLCKTCVLQKKIDRVPADASPGEVETYQRQVRHILDTDQASDTGTQAAYLIDRLYVSMFGPLQDFSSVKRHFNTLMMGYVPQLKCALQKSPDPLALAIRYAMVGNLIDFAALERVDESQLQKLLLQAGRLPLDPRVLEDFRHQITGAQALAYVTDNCGEIVMDQLLMQTLKEHNPALKITAVVRGLPVVNDATLEDASQINLTEDVCVIGNGSDFPGMDLQRCSEEAKEVLARADLIVSKGQANYETLVGSGLNIFYIFMCKCKLFTEHFQVPQFTGLITKELSS